ncbi:uncharacterized protein LOC142767195 [Rhipicephalus microplus]|uniref:uncharacterized protein LOC142767195 n=1 Tax=Rhipicephalus microplus TaxID=6941 RepID=UPI003F6B5B37
MPGDGVCDYLIYDSVYKKGPAPFDPHGMDASLNIFLNGGSQMTKTKLGISFAYKYRQNVMSELTTTNGTVAVVVKYFLDRHICNFGILDVPTNSVDKSSVEEMLEILKVLHDLTISKRTIHRRCLTIFASSPTSPNSDKIYVGAFLKIFTPDVVVMLSHYAEGDNTFEDCRVVPPTMLQRPISIFSNSSYKNDMHKAADTLRKLTIQGVVASWALSVTMKGRWSVLKPGQPADFLSECVHDPSAESFGSYTEVCENPDFRGILNYKTGVRGTLYYSRSDGRMFSYDNDTTFVEKLCRIRVLQLTFAIGVVAFDIDYDDYSTICGELNQYRAFTRLYTLVDILDYFKKKFNDAGELKDCLFLAE